MQLSSCAEFNYTRVSLRRLYVVEERRRQHMEIPVHASTKTFRHSLVLNHKIDFFILINISGQNYHN